MKKKDLKETLKQEIESEAATLERRVSTKKHLATLEMPKDSYKELMERIKAREKEMKEEKANARLHQRAKILPFPAPARRKTKTWATVAMVAVLVAGTGVGVKGARLYMLKVERQEGKLAFDIMTDTEDILYVELGEEEAYEKIENEIGILALRLADKPNGMKLDKVYIEAEMGEAIMEFHNSTNILSIYENKQYNNASFNAQLDGKEVDIVKTFYLEKELEIDKKDGNRFYWVQMEYGNAYYQLSTDMELEEFKNILYGLVFKNE